MHDLTPSQWNRYGVQIHSSQVLLRLKILPCHRVTRGAEPPEAYIGGSARRQQLHELEA